MMRKLYLQNLVVFGVGVVLLMAAVYSFLSSPQIVVLASAVSVTPTRPASPPLPTAPVSTVVPSPSIESEGALIWLRVQGQPIDSHWQSLWTVVQWQDAFGDWHDVEGWRGTLDEVGVGEGRKVWWLPADLFGVGPFRWQVYTQPAGALLATSQAFYLPDLVGQIEVVTVTGNNFRE
ncbi:MAG: hypothetical protein JXA33_10565 [Anaerolineae bacterium]|nr:hypothetical protein [Anaerolineae bacterium]